MRDLTPPIARVVVNLQSGELSSPFPIGKYHSIVRLDELIPATLDDRMYDFLLDELFARWVKSEIANKIIPHLFTSEHNSIEQMTDRIQISIQAERLIYHLSRSKLLIPYLRQTIVKETLDKWQQTVDYRRLKSVTPATPKTLLQQYQQAEWGHLVTSRFLQRKSQLDRVLFSAIQVTDFSLASELYCRICEQKQSFTQLATKYSQRPSAKMGGAVGTIFLSQLHPLIYHHLIGLKPKQISPIFQLDDCYIFIRLDRWLPAQFDERIKRQLLNELFEEWLERQISDRISAIDRTTLTPTVESNLVPDRSIIESDLSTTVPEKSIDLIAPTTSIFFPTSIFNVSR